jgi:two-component system, chemotaxis family, chemotaxis protein CheY
MKTQKKCNFIVIDDDDVNNVLCNITISSVASNASVKTFNRPTEGLEFIRNEYSDLEEIKPTIIFLDINMPIWSGWDFLDYFCKENEKVQQQIKIYLLSSSVDPKDFERAKAHQKVEDLIVKPLTKEIILKASKCEGCGT